MAVLIFEIILSWPRAKKQFLGKQLLFLFLVFLQATARKLDRGGVASDPLQWGAYGWILQSGEGQLTSRS